MLHVTINQKVYLKRMWSLSRDTYYRQDHKRLFLFLSILIAAWVALCLLIFPGRVGTEILTRRWRPANVIPFSLLMAACAPTGAPPAASWNSTTAGHWKDGKWAFARRRFDQSRNWIPHTTSCAFSIGPLHEFQLFRHPSTFFEEEIFHGFLVHW